MWVLASPFVSKLSLLSSFYFLYSNFVGKTATYCKFLCLFTPVSVIHGKPHVKGPTFFRFYVIVMCSTVCSSFLVRVLCDLFGASVSDLWSLV